MSVCWEVQRAKTVQPVNEEHLCLINLPIFVCDEEAGNEAPDHAATPEYPEARKGLFVFFYTLLNPSPKDEQWCRSDVCI